MTLFEEQAFPRTKRAKQYQRENVCVWNNGFTAEYCCSSFTRNITHTCTQACALLYKQYVSVHKCTLNISGGSVHSRLPEPQAKCSPRQTDHDPISSPTLRVWAQAQCTKGVCASVHMCSTTRERATRAAIHNYSLRRHNFTFLKYLA